MGGNTSSEAKQKSNGSGAASSSTSLVLPGAVPNAELYRGKGVEDLIQAAQHVPSEPLGRSERTLNLALIVLRLLDDPTLHDPTPQPFSETFKWSVLSMLRSCDFCRTRHCPLQHQCKILPPMRSNLTNIASFTDTSSCSSGSAGDPIFNSIVEKLPPPFVPTVDGEGRKIKPAESNDKDKKQKNSRSSNSRSDKRPAMMSFACDNCANNLFLERHRCLSDELARIERRTHGFSSSTLEFDVVDGDERYLYSASASSGAAAAAAADTAEAPEPERLPGITDIQSGIFLPPPAAAEKGGGSSSSSSGTGSVVITSISIGTARLKDETFLGALHYPLTQLKINVIEDGLGQPDLRVQEGRWAEILQLAGKNNLPALGTVKRLELRSHHATVGSGIKNVLPLRDFRVLEVVNLLGWMATVDDLTFFNCETTPALRQVVMVNQPAHITQRVVLNTLGALPLHLLSIAQMRSGFGQDEDKKDEFSSSNPLLGRVVKFVRSRGKEDDGDDGGDAAATAVDKATTTALEEFRDVRSPPILVSTLIAWAGDGLGTRGVAKILLRASLLEVLDVSETQICITTVLSVAAFAGVASLRIFRANNVDCSSSPAGSTTAVRHAVPEELDSFANWSSLVGLSTLQLSKLRLPPHSSAFERFSTLPAVTTCDVSFPLDQQASPGKVIYAFVAALSKTRTLATLNISFTRPRHSSYAAARSSGSSSSRTNEPLVFPALRRLNMMGLPPDEDDFPLRYDGTPLLEHLSMNKDNSYMKMPLARLANFIESVGKTVKRLDLNCDGSETAIARLPVQALTQLEHMHFIGDAFVAFGGNDTVSLLRTATKLKTLDLRKKSLETTSDIGLALDGSGIVSLDLSNTNGWTGFRGGGGSSSDPIVLPSMKKFWFRNDAGPTLASRAVCPDLHKFLAAQPTLEFIDVQGAFFNSNQGSAKHFWATILARNTLRFLNIAKARATNTGGGASSSLPLATDADTDRMPDSLSVLRFTSDQLSSEFVQKVANSRGLRAVWCTSFSTEVVEEGAVQEWVVKLSSKAVQVNFAMESNNNNEAYSI